MDNLEERDEFLEKYNLPNLNQEEIESINRFITSMEIKTVIRNFPPNKSPGPDCLTGEFYQIFREELTPNLGKHWKGSDFILGGSKITADDDCSNEIKRPLLLGRKSCMDVRVGL